jgi:PEP-CTERM motif
VGNEGSRISLRQLPEPSQVAMLAAGIALLGSLVRRRSCGRNGLRRRRGICADIGSSSQAPRRALAG